MLRQDPVFILLVIVLSACQPKDYDEQEEVLSSKELVEGHSGYADLDVSSAAAEGLQKHWGVSADQEAWQEDQEEGHQNEEIEDDAKEEEEHPDLWFLCDGCKMPIPGGKRRFDCAVCENFTLCMKCFRIRRHPHKFIRRRVPESCTPPEDFKGMQFGTGDEEGKSLDEYFQLDYEDIIGGDLPTRFKYRKVEPNDYGIPANEILSKTSKELNQMVSIKKLRPYRDDADGHQPGPKRKKEGKGNQGNQGKGKGKGSGKGRDKGGKGQGKADKRSKKDQKEKGDQVAI